MCGLQGFTQACHGDEGKGLGMKACDLTCWPGCGPHAGIPGCHWFVGTSGRMTREARRGMEQRAAKETQERLRFDAVVDSKLRAVLLKVGLL